MDNPSRFAAHTMPGKIAVGLSTFFVVVTAIAVMLVLVFHVLNFDDTWWDVTVAILTLSTLIALICGVWTLIKKDRSSAVWVSLLVSVAAVLFGLLHSLFISD